MHWVYHKTLPGKIVDTDTYYQLVDSGEWFDRPQLIHLRGNSDEYCSPKQIQNEGRKGSQSKHESIGNRSFETKDPDICSDKQGNSSEEKGRFPIETKKRGRPLKKNGL